MEQKTIVLIHFKTGERDGVSLEIEKRKRILTSLGENVRYISGFDGLQRKEAYVIEEFHAETRYTQCLREQCFRCPTFDESAMVAFYAQLELTLYKKIQQAILELQPKLVFVHNVFSHGCHLPASTALLKVLDKYEIPTVAVHHDFWYEREQLQYPQYPFIRELLDVHPPKRNYILKHQVINSLACQEILKRRRIQAVTIGDYFDFQQPTPQKDVYNSDLRTEFGIKENDILILHATRITVHKVIENALLFARTFEEMLHAGTPLRIAGKIFDDSSRVVVLFPNFVEPEATDYYALLRAYQEELGVRVVWGTDRFLPERRQRNGVKIYSFWDSYVAADLVTYTSIQEGFGNQFLEAVYFQKLPVILEYPVFENDLRPEGYEYVSLGPSSQLGSHGDLRLAEPNIVHAAAKCTVGLLRDPAELMRITQKNFHIAQRHHDVTVLQQDLEHILQSLQSS